jgi:hypothetical protein
MHYFKLGQATLNLDSLLHQHGSLEPLSGGSSKTSCPLPGTFYHGQLAGERSLATISTSSQPASPPDNAEAQRIPLSWARS